MKKIAINLNQDYKSFKTGFSYSFHGDLILLSGVNGSGKSQLIDILSQRESRGNRKTINAEIFLDDQKITRNDILKRSFKDNINVPELTHAGTETVRSHQDQAWNAYHNYLLNPNDEHLWDYVTSCDEAKKLLIDKFGIEKFNSRQLQQNEVRDALPTNFVWKSDDIFTNFIGELFFNYASDVYDAEAEAGKSGVKFDSTSLPEPPWKQLNSLFSELGFDYKFKDNYFVKKFQINEQPTLFQKKDDGTIDQNQERKLADLSDGEKAIISLAFASLSGVRHDDKKLLLLDEFDANFNPSLTEVFYKIVDKYFASKGIVVIIATHSATTISLAPENVNFYEVFKNETSGSKRILPVLRDDYTELEKANKKFYTKIADQKARLDELEKEHTNLSDLAKVSKPSLFVEGDIDVQYLNKAAEYEPEWKATLEKLEVQEKGGKDQLARYWINRNQIKEFLKQSLILLFDDDANRPDADDAPIFLRRIPLVADNSVKRGIENLFNNELILKAEKSTNKKFVAKSIPDTESPDKEVWKVIDDEKKNLADWICANATKEDFESFGSIFDSLSKIV